MDSITLKRKIRTLWSKIDSRLSKSVLLYVWFLFISFVFWLVLSLNNSLQQEFAIPLKLKSVNDSTTIITHVPQSVKIALKDRGVAMLKYKFGNLPTLQIDFDKYSDGRGLIRVSSADLMSELRSNFSATSVITAVNPDSLRLLYTNLPPKKVPLCFDLDVQPNLQYVINGAVRSNVDSVLVYSDKNTLSALTEVYTYHVEERDLTDTLVREVAVAPIVGAKIVPKSVRLTIPVEQLIYKKQRVPVLVIDQPANINVLTFPAMVEASFLVPQSMYRKTVGIKAAVYYNDVLESATNHVAVRVVEAPAICKSVSLSVDSVEYIIEKHSSF